MKKQQKQCEHRFKGLVLLNGTFYCQDCGMQADKDYRGNWHYETLPIFLKTCQ